MGKNQESHFIIFVNLILEFLSDRHSKRQESIRLSLLMDRGKVKDCTVHKDKKTWMLHVID